jgi:hypothetical protein
MASMTDHHHTWRELYRCNDLRQARAVATTIAAMEFDVRLASASIEARMNDERHETPADDSPSHPGACNRITAFINSNDEDELPGPYVIEVPDSTWPQLADVLFEIIAEQQEFDQMLEWRRERNRVRLVVVLSITTAAEAAVVWRLLEG